MDRKIKINGASFNIGNLDFTNVMCELEDYGIDTIGILKGENEQYYLICKALISVITGFHPEAAEKVLKMHLQNGGSMCDIIGVLLTLATDAGFNLTAEVKN